MLDTRFSAAVLAKLAGLPLPTLTFFLREGILEPSVQRASGRGRGHVFDVADLVAARTLNALRYPSTAAAPFKTLVQFWHSPEGRDLIKATLRRPDRRVSRILFLTDTGVELDVPPAVVMKKYKTSVVHCIDVGAIIDELNLASTEGLMRLEFQEPASSGRVPPRQKAKPTPRRAKRGMADAQNETKQNKKKRRPRD